MIPFSEKGTEINAAELILISMIFMFIEKSQIELLLIRSLRFTGWFKFYSYACNLHVRLHLC